jgi:hypothetical protein
VTEPRFRVVSTTGYGSLTATRLSSSWQVLDCGPNFALVGEWAPRNGGGERNSGWCERRAREAAELLNAGEYDAANLLLGERTRITASDGLCKGCGAPRSERSPGCASCRDRHRKRARAARRA